jgi:uracil-DNA glycosylase
MSNLKVKLVESLNNDWEKVLNSSISAHYFSDLCLFLETELSTQVIFPPRNHIFAAFQASSFQHTKVVIVGQDPYHGEGQAQGLSFSVPSAFPVPPSLRNIYKELFDDLKAIRPDGDLRAWASQGVLLLNSVLTVRSGEPGSHAKQGWEKFTEEVIIQLSQQKESVVFVLWGAYAQKLAKHIDEQKHLVIQAAHPSPLSANRGGFLGTKPFSQINRYLVEMGKEPIDWARE